MPEYITIRNKYTGKVLDVDGDKNVIASNAEIMKFSQLWYIDENRITHIWSDGTDKYVIESTSTCRNRKPMLGKYDADNIRFERLNEYIQLSSNEQVVLQISDNLEIASRKTDFGNQHWTFPKAKIEYVTVRNKCGCRILELTGSAGNYIITLSRLTCKRSSRKQQWYFDSQNIIHSRVNNYVIINNGGNLELTPFDFANTNQMLKKNGSYLEISGVVMEASGKSAVTTSAKRYSCCFKVKDRKQCWKFKSTT